MNQELKYYMNLSYRMEIVEDKDEGGYVLSYPDLPGCMTCSDSLDDLLELAKDVPYLFVKSSVALNLS